MRSRMAVLLFLLPTACGFENALVGGRCKDGLEVVDGRCTQTAPPPSTPYAANVPVPSGSTDRSVSGFVAPRPMPMPGGDAGTIDPSDASTDDGATADAAISLASPIDASLLPEVCAPSEVLCHGACIDGSADGNNCGACGKICPSNICINGECQGATPGDVVAIGHDFAPTWIGAAQGKILVNAMSIPTTDPIRVLAFEEGGAPASVAQANAIVAAGVAPRKVQVTLATPEALASVTLSQSYDVVLIHDVATADPVALGARFVSSLARFTEKGGVVVALDGGFGRMPELVSSAGLLPIASHTILPVDTHVVVTAPSDAVGVQVISPYAGPGTSVTFGGVTLGADVTAVVRPVAGAGFGDPIVVHRVVR